ncbi:MAG: DUF58 domain-containing protein [Deltaproteobacteria bacterium]|nr:DUF58 domain-containing protein [Deltaproteobacteria bacterium]
MSAASPEPVVRAGAVAGAGQVARAGAVAGAGQVVSTGPDAVKPWPAWSGWTAFRDQRGKTPAWRRKLIFTSMGRWYCGLTVGIGLAAINTGNNLLFLVVGALLSGIVVSGILSERAITGMQVERKLPLSATVGQPALVGLWVKNVKPRTDSFSIEVREAGSEVAGGVFLLTVRPGEEAEPAYRFVPQRRGKHVFERLEIATRSPFGLFEKARPLDRPGELIVFPRIVEPRVVAARAQGAEGERPLDKAGSGLEMHGLREHRTGEDARSIHWRSSARAGKLIGVEREEERRRRVCVLLDSRTLGGQRLETAIEQAAALFTQALDEGAEVALSLPGQGLQSGSGAAHRRAGLSMLALLFADKNAHAPVVPPRMMVLDAGSVT